HFSEDQDGNVLICDDGGGIFQLERAPKVEHKPFPQKLSETGLFVSTKENKPHPGLIPYSVNSPLWSDGAGKERFIALPGGERIDYKPSNGWDFPNGSVLVKTFSLGDKRIETRLLAKQANDWHGYTYIWDEGQNDAMLVGSGGMDRDYVVNDKKQTWHYPSRAECLVCHSRAANFVLGLNELQMNKGDQLYRLEEFGVFKVDWMGPTKEAVKKDAMKKGLKEDKAGEFADSVCPAAGQRTAVESTLLNKRPESLTKMVDPYDASADLNKRARSYLHANCSICHVEAGGGNAKIDLSYSIPESKMSLFDEKPVHHTFGIEGAKLVANGEPEKSVLLKRVSMRGEGQMPQLATSVVDEKAVQMLREWIKSRKARETQRAEGN
ncbi:MAG TPA: hypothetical protein VGP99_02595, partial [Tepidisphaeraceae bacterium]|nr:hypothetical protein [Tepidisphaeraceae bacterium]